MKLYLITDSELRCISLLAFSEKATMCLATALMTAGCFAPDMGHGILATVIAIIFIGISAHTWNTRKNIVLRLKEEHGEK